MSILRIFLNLWLVLFCINGTAASSNPVISSLSPTSGFAPVEVGGSTTVTYTLTSHLPGPQLFTTMFAETGQAYGHFTITDNCNNQIIAAEASCTVIIQYVPTAQGTATIQMTYKYSNNVVPIKPILSISGTGTTQIVGTISGLPTTISLSQSPQFTATYTNHGSADVTGYAGNSAGTNLLSSSQTSVATVSVVSGSNLCGTSSAPKLLKAGHSCTIQGQVTPIANGTFTVTGLYTYNNGANTATATGNSEVTSTPPPPTDCLSGEATLPFPTSTYQYADNILQFTFKNSCNTATSALGTIAITSNASPTITKGSLYNASYDTCSGQSIPAMSSCVVLVSVVPQAVMDGLTVTATVPSSTVSATSSTNVNAPSYEHNVTFVNQCPFPVWYGVLSPGDPTPNPSPSAYQLTAQSEGVAPDSKTITFGLGNTYSGVMLPRTGCTAGVNSFTCVTGDCGSGATGQCSNSAYEPYTRIEEVFYQPPNINQGNYDISLQVGASIPVEFKGLGPSTNQYASDSASFVCSGAGAPIPLSFINPPYLSNIELGYCPWTYSAPNSPSEIFNFVSTDTTTSLTNCNSCSSPNVCGLAYQTPPVAFVQSNIILACGKRLGYWTINEFGTMPESAFNLLPAAYNPYTVFQLTLPLSTTGFAESYPSGNAYDLYACTPQGDTLQTCYPSVSGDACCGAQNWNQAGSYGSYLTAQAGAAAVNLNPDWTGTNGSSPLMLSPYDSIVWLKQACPTAYSYPFDDQSVSFTCNYNNASQTGSQVAMDFQVVFCPGGLTSDLSTNP